MRASTGFFLLCLFLVCLNLFFVKITGSLYLSPRKESVLSIVVSELHLTDPCISTEARYTRHPSVTDLLVPFMDHPGAIEHFPSGSFWAPPHTWKN